MSLIKRFTALNNMVETKFVYNNSTMIEYKSIIRIIQIESFQAVYKKILGILIK